MYIFLRFNNHNPHSLIFYSLLLMVNINQSSHLLLYEICIRKACDIKYLLLLIIIKYFYKKLFYLNKILKI